MGFLPFLGLGIELRVSCMLGKCSSIKPPPQSPSLPLCLILSLTGSLSFSACVSGGHLETVLENIVPRVIQVFLVLQHVIDQVPDSHLCPVTSNLGRKSSGGKFPSSWWWEQVLPKSDSYSKVCISPPVTNAATVSLEELAYSISQEYT